MRFTTVCVLAVAFAMSTPLAAQSGADEQPVDWRTLALTDIDIQCNGECSAVLLAPAGELFKLFGFTAENIGKVIDEVTG